MESAVGQNMMRFRDRVAIVTGASSGIGLAVSRRLSREGAKVILFARGAERLAQAVSGSDTMMAVTGDVGSSSDVEKLFARCLKELGPPSILVNNAGMVVPAGIEEMTEESWEEHFNINVSGAFRCIRRAVPLMKENGGGTIVNIGSISGVSGPEKFGGFAAYASAKAALMMLSETLGAELRGTGIRINCVNPGSVDTPMLRSVAPNVTPDMTPDEVAETVAFLCSDASRAINGQNINVYSS